MRKIVLFAVAALALVASAASACDHLASLGLNCPACAGAAAPTSYSQTTVTRTVSNSGYGSGGATLSAPIPDPGPDPNVNPAPAPAPAPTPYPSCNTNSLSIRSYGRGLGLPSMGGYSNVQGLQAASNFSYNQSTFGMPGYQTTLNLNLAAVHQSNRVAHANARVQIAQAKLLKAQAVANLKAVKQANRHGPFAAGRQRLRSAVQALRGY